jgi:septal ring factor EnvC (AmiA/AmiB activator)
MAAQSKSAKMASSSEKHEPAGNAGNTPAAMREAINKLNKSLQSLENAINAHLEREMEMMDATAEVQRMGADRSRLAVSLDEAEARSQRLEATNREVSRRLVAAMEAIRAVLDREN